MKLSSKKTHLAAVTTVQLRARGLAQKYLNGGNKGRAVRPFFFFSFPHLDLISWSGNQTIHLFRYREETYSTHTWEAWSRFPY